MKMTNTQRNAFVNAVMDDVPSVDYSEMIREKAVKAALPHLPPAVVKLWNNPETRAFLREGSIYVHGVNIAFPGVDWRANKDLAEMKAAEAAARDACQGIADKAKAQEETRKALRARLSSAAYSVSTRKALADLLPEFARYLPPEPEAARNLPAIANVVADFTKAGWPKGGKSARAAQ